MTRLRFAITPVRPAAYEASLNFTVGWQIFPQFEDAVAVRFRHGTRLRHPERLVRTRPYGYRPVLRPARRSKTLLARQHAHWDELEPTLSRIWFGRCRGCQGLVQSAGQRYLAVQPGQAEQLPILRPGQATCRLAPCAAARLAAPTSAPSPAESMKLTWSSSTTSGGRWPPARKAARAARSRWQCQSPRRRSRSRNPFAPDPDGQYLVHVQPPTRPGHVLPGPGDRYRPCSLPVRPEPLSALPPPNPRAATRHRHSLLMNHQLMSSIGPRHDYGRRDITVCPGWRNPAAFIAWIEGKHQSQATPAYPGGCLACTPGR